MCSRAKVSFLSDEKGHHHQVHCRQDSDQNLGQPGRGECVRAGNTGFPSAVTALSPSGPRAKGRRKPETGTSLAADGMRRRGCWVPEVLRHSTGGARRPWETPGEHVSLLHAREDSKADGTWGDSLREPCGADRCQMYTRNVKRRPSQPAQGTKT